MSKRSTSVLKVSEEDLARMMEQNGTTIISDLSRALVVTPKVEERTFAESARKQQQTADHSLNHLIGSVVKMAKDAPIWKSKTVTLIALDDRLGKVWATVCDKTGAEKDVDASFVIEKAAHKHGAKPGWEDGFYFKSEGERKRYLSLKLFQGCGEISLLKVSPRFLLQEKFEYRGIKFPAQHYTADFQYVVEGITWIEDWKTVDKRKNSAYVANKTQIGRFLAAYPTVNFVLVSHLHFLPGEKGIQCVQK